MRVLYIAPLIPWPLDRGNRVRIYNFLKELSSRHEVDAVFLAERGYAFLSEAEKELSALCGDLRIVRQANWNGPVRAALAVARRIAYYTRGIGNAEFYYNLWPLNSAIRECLLRKKYDVLFSNYWFTAIDPIRRAGCPTVCDTHDVIWEQANNLNVETNAVGRWFRKRHLERIKRRERETLNGFDRLLCVSARDAQLLRDELSVVAQYRVIAHVRSQVRLPFALPTAAGDTILFFGALHSGMNMDGARHAALDLYPRIREQCPGARLVIAGSGAGPEIRALADGDGVTVQDYVPDLESLFRGAKVLLLPLRMGSGIKGRVLEAMEAGLPVIGTGVTMQGIPAEHGKSAIVSDDQGELVEWTVRLLKDDALRCRIARGALDFVTGNYSWESTYGKIHGILKELTLSRAKPSFADCPLVLQGEDREKVSERDGI